MSPGTIFRKTMIFTWIKLGIAILTLFIAMCIAGTAYLVITQTELGLINDIAIGCAAFLIIVAIYYVIMYRLGYNIKIGHLTIVETARGGRDIPSNPVAFSKNIVRERFGSNRKFHLLSHDMRSAVSQIVRIILRGFTLDRDTPDIRPMRGILFLFCHPAISCADECCITYALRQRSYEVNAACIDALTILVQNWDSFIKRAVRLSAFVFIAFILMFVLFFLPGLGIANALVLSPIPWAIVSVCLALAFKSAFLDSWVLTKIVCEFLDIAQNAEIDPKNYAKISTWSKSYGKIRAAANKAAKNADSKANAQNTENANPDAKSAPDHNDEIDPMMMETPLSDPMIPETDEYDPMMAETPLSGDDNEENAPTDAEMPPAETGETDKIADMASESGKNTPAP